MQSSLVRAAFVVAPLLLVDCGACRAQFQPPTFNPPSPPSFQPPQINRPQFNPPQFTPPQFNPPTFTPPPMPRIVKSWRCSKCGANLGEGDFPPAQCGSCGARIINGFGGASGAQVPATQSPTALSPFRVVGGSWSVSWSNKIYYSLGALAAVGMIAGGVVIMAKCGGIEPLLKVLATR